MQRAIESDRQFFTRILLPVIAFALVAILFAVLGLFSSTWQSDRLSMDREIRTTQLAIDRSIQELAREQEVVAIRDRPLIELRKTNPNWQWFDRAFGGRLHNSFQHDQVYILGSRDEPLYAMVAGARVAPGRFESIKPDVQRMLDVVRGRIRQPNHRHGRNPGQPRPKDGSILTTEKAVHQSLLLSIGGEPAGVSVMLMAPLSTNVQQAKGSEPVAISIRFLDADFFRSLAMTTLLEGPRFSRTAELQPGERSLILKGDDGEAIGNFIWTPERAGSQIFDILAPVTAAVLLALLGLLGWLARSLHRSFYRLRREVVIREEAEVRAEALARHDSLTGLPNRRLFVEELEKLCAKPADAPSSPGALMLANVDSMRGLNETWGFATMDELLVQLGRRLQNLAGPDGLVARTGGDEFSIFVSARDGSADVGAFVESICAALKEPFTVDTAVVPAGVTAGVALFPAHGATPGELINAADAALARGKRDARSGCTVYNSQTDVSGRSGSTVRELHQPPGGRQRFELTEVADTAFRTTCRAAAEWPSETALCLCVPAALLSDPWFAARLLAILNSTGLAPTRLLVEVPEAALVSSYHQCTDNLTELKAAGIRIAVGDISGHVSPAHWRTVTFDQIRVNPLPTPLANRTSQAAGANSLA